MGSANSTSWESEIIEGRGLGVASGNAPEKSSLDSSFQKAQREQSIRVVRRASMLKQNLERNLKQETDESLTQKQNKNHLESHRKLANKVTFTPTATNEEMQDSSVKRRTLTISLQGEGQNLSLCKTNTYNILKSTIDFLVEGFKLQKQNTEIVIENIKTTGSTAVQSDVLEDVLEDDSETIMDGLTCDIALTINASDEVTQHAWNELRAFLGFLKIDSHNNCDEGPTNKGAICAVFERVAEEQNNNKVLLTRILSAKVQLD